MATVNIPPVKDLVEKIDARLQASGWSDVLKDFLFSPEFEQILRQLQHEVTVGNRFTPSLKMVFRAFETCPYNKLHTVFIGTEPYFTAGVADGLLLSTPNGARKPAALVRFQQQICETIYTPDREMKSDLEYIAQQGVLLLNAALTTKIGEPVAHYEIWKPFLDYLFKQLSKHESLVFVYLGRQGQQFSEFIGDKHVQFYLEHPAQATREEGWNCYDIFNRVNRLLLENGDLIIW